MAINITDEQAKDLVMAIYYLEGMKRGLDAASAAFDAGDQDTGYKNLDVVRITQGYADELFTGLFGQTYNELHARCNWAT